MREKILGNKKNKKEHDNFVNLDSDLSDQEDLPKHAKRQRKQTEPKKRKAPTPITGDLNLIKTSNKLIGEIQNNDLYNSDDDFRDKSLYNAQTENLRGQEIDFGTKTTQSNNFLNKMKTKKMETGNSIE